MHQHTGQPGLSAPRTRRITTPFVGSLSPAQIEAQAVIHACPADANACRRQVAIDLAEARPRLGLSSPTLSVLLALLSFLPGDAMTAGPDDAPIAFPSNRALGLRARGLSEPTLRRHLAVLVEAGLIIRRDSPNGKRYARRGPGGQITHAFGFDLTPLVVRASEIAALAEAARAEALARKLAWEKLTLLRRDGAKLIEALAQAEVALTGTPAPAGPDTAAGLRAGYHALLAALPRRPDLAALDTVFTDIEALVLAVSNALARHSKTRESSGNGAHAERHQQNSNTEPFEYEEATGERMKPAAEHQPGRARLVASDSGIRSTYPLAMVLDACPQIRDFAPSGIRSWAELVDTAVRIRPMLGISPDAWHEAREAMGADAAAVTLAAILERHEAIKSPGGYLRSLTERKRVGTFSLGPVLQALHRRRLSAGPACGGVRDAG